MQHTKTIDVLVERMKGIMVPQLFEGVRNWLGPLGRRCNRGSIIDIGWRRSN